MVADDVARTLEPEGLGHDLLTEWGLWMRDNREGRESWAVRPRVDRGYHGDPPERVRFVDKLIARHRLRHHEQWSVVSRFYLSDYEPWQISRELGRRHWPEARIRTILLAVCGMIEREYRDWTGG